MGSIAVTGAAGSLGRRVLDQLVFDDQQDDAGGVSRDRIGNPIIAIDSRPVNLKHDRVSDRRLDLATADLQPHLAGCSTVVHLAEGAGRVQDHLRAEFLLERVLDASEAAGVDHLVILSSAMVYGAHQNNPVPLNESEPLRSNDELAFVVAKRNLEGLADTWAAGGRVVTVLRPTTTLAEWGTSWVARSLRAATLLRPDQVDPPVQFLHFDDLATAVDLAVRKRLPGRYNVAPDGWLGSEEFGELIGGMHLRAPTKITDAVLRAGKATGIRPTPDGIGPYVKYPWVVANDRLRSAGWKPEYTNAEAFVLGTAAPIWSIPPKRRQEVALIAAGLGAAGLAAGAVALSRRLFR